MSIEEICKHVECGHIEYKREWYWRINNNELKSTEKNRLWGEFIKDFLALINANVASFGETRYMVIGFDEENHVFKDCGINESSFIKLDKNIKSKLDNFISYFSETDYSISLELIDNKNIIIIKIEQPYKLYYLKDDIQTKTITYKRNTVLYRGNDGNYKGNNDNIGVMSPSHIKQLERKILAKYGSNFTPLEIQSAKSIYSTVASYLEKNTTFVMSDCYPIYGNDSQKYFELYELKNSMNDDRIYIAYIAESNLKGSLENLYREFQSINNPTKKLFLLINKPSDSSQSRRIVYIKSAYKSIFGVESNVEFIEDFGKKFLYQEYLQPMLFNQYFQNTEFFIESFSSKINTNQKRVVASRLLKSWYKADNRPLIVLTGSGGVGKTTIVRNFLNTNLKINEDQYVLFLDSSSLLDKLKSDRVSTIYDLYRASITDSEFFTEELFKLSIDNGSFVIVLDGLDEIISGVNVEFQLKGFLRNIFEGYCFNLVKTKIIITCRDYIWEEAFNRISEEFSIECIEIQPFNKNQSEEFFRSRFKDSIKLQKKAMSMVKNLMSQSKEGHYSPFMLDTISNLVQDNTSQEGIESIFEITNIEADKLGLKKNNILDYLIYAVCKREVKKINIDLSDQIKILCKLSTMNTHVNKTQFIFLVNEVIKDTNDTTISLLLNHTFINYISEKAISIKYDFLKDFFLKISIVQLFSNINTASIELLDLITSKAGYLNNFSLNIGSRLLNADKDDIHLSTLQNLDNIYSMLNAEDSPAGRVKYYQYISNIFILYLSILKSKEIIKDNEDLRIAMLEVFSNKQSHINKFCLCNIRELKSNPKLLFDFSGLTFDDCFIYDYYGFIDCKFDEETLFNTGSIRISHFKNNESTLRKDNFSKKISLLDSTSEIIDSIDNPEQTNHSRNIKHLKTFIKLFHNNGRFQPRKSAEVRKKKGGDLADNMLRVGVILTNRNSKLNQEEYKINPEYEIKLFKYIDSNVITPEIHEIIEKM